MTPNRLRYNWLVLVMLVTLFATPSCFKEEPTPTAVVPSPTAVAASSPAAPVAAPTSASAAAVRKAVPLAIGTKVSVDQDRMLWANLNTTLVPFITSGIEATEKNGLRWSAANPEPFKQALDSFALAFADVQNVAAPQEQGKFHSALLPIYGDIHNAMRTIVAGIVAGDNVKPAVEWERLKLLIGEARSTIGVQRPCWRSTNDRYSAGCAIRGRRFRSVAGRYPGPRGAARDRPAH